MNEGTPEKDRVQEPISGRRRTQRSIIDAEIFWYGRVLNGSDEVHTMALVRPFVEVEPVGDLPVDEIADTVNDGAI